MQVALYARVSTPQQQLEGTIASQVQSLKAYIHQQQWSLLHEHEFLDEGISGGRLDRPGLDRLRDAARRGELDAVVILSPDRLARNYAHQWLLIEEFEKAHTPLIFLQNPFGNSPQGKLLTQMQGMIAEYERAQIVERTRRGRLEKARSGQFIPWAFHCYGYQYLPKRHGCPPEVMIDPAKAEVVRSIFRALVDEQLTCRQITKRLNQSGIPTPSGKNAVWQIGTVAKMLTNPTYAGEARYNRTCPIEPRSRRNPNPERCALKTSRSYRPESEWVWSSSPALISRECFEKAQLQLARNAQLARRIYRPASRRYLLRRLVYCGQCGLAMVCLRQLSRCKRKEYLYYGCKGHAPLTCGRAQKCPSRHVRADRLDTLVWESLDQLLRAPAVIPQLHQTWAQAREVKHSMFGEHQKQLMERQGRLQQQNQRLLDAYQAEAIGLAELKTRQGKLRGQIQAIEQELQQLQHTQQQAIHWQQVIENAETFRQLLGKNLEELCFENRQTVAQCLITKVIVTGDQVDVCYALPFESAPQACHAPEATPAGAPNRFYRLRLRHLHLG